MMLVLLNLGLSSSTAAEFGEKIPSTPGTDSALKRTRLAKITSDIKARPYSTRYKNSETSKAGEDEVSNRDQMISVIAAPPTAFVRSELKGKDFLLEDVIKKSQVVSDADPKEDDFSDNKFRRKEKTTTPSSTDLNKKLVRKRIVSQRFRERQRVQTNLGQQTSEDYVTPSENVTDELVGESDVTEHFSQRDGKGLNSSNDGRTNSSDGDSNDDDSQKNQMPYKRLRSGSVRRRGNNTFYAKVRGGERPNGQLSNSRGLRLRARFTTSTEVAAIDSTEAPEISTVTSVFFDEINSAKIPTSSIQKELPQGQIFDSIGFNIAPQNDPGHKSTSSPTQFNDNVVSFKRQTVRVTTRPLGISQRGHLISPETVSTTAIIPAPNISPTSNSVTVTPTDKVYTVTQTTSSVPANGFISPTSHIRSTVYQFGPSFSAIEHGKVNLQEDTKNPEDFYIKNLNHHKLPNKDTPSDNTQRKKLKTSSRNRCDGVYQSELAECKTNEESLPTHILESTRDIIRQAQNEEVHRAAGVGGSGGSSGSSGSSVNVNSGGSGRGRGHGGIRSHDTTQGEQGGAISFSSSSSTADGPESPWQPGKSVGQTTPFGDFKRQYRSPSASLRQQPGSLRQDSPLVGDRLHLTDDNHRQVTPGNLFRDDVIKQQQGEEGVSWRERRPTVELTHSGIRDGQRDAGRHEQSTPQDFTSSPSERPSVFDTFDQFLISHGVTETGFSAVPAPEKHVSVKNTSSTPTAVSFQNSYIENVRQALEIEPPIAVRPGRLEKAFTLNDHPNSIHSTKNAIASADFNHDNPSTRVESRLPLTGFSTHAQDIYFSTPKTTIPNANFVQNDQTRTTQVQPTYNPNNFSNLRNQYPANRDTISLTHSQPQNNHNLGTPNIQSFVRTTTQQPSNPPKQSLHYSNVNSEGIDTSFGQQGAIGHSISFLNQGHDFNSQSFRQKNKAPPPKRHVSSVSHEPLHHAVSQNSKEPAFLSHQTRSRGNFPDPKTHFQLLQNENVPSTRSHFRAVLLEGASPEFSPAKQQHQQQQQRQQQQQKLQLHHQQQLQHQQQGLNRQPQKVNVGIWGPSAPGRLPPNALIQTQAKRPVRHFNPNRPPLVLGRGNVRPMRLRNQNVHPASGLSNVMRPPPRRRAHPKANPERQNSNIRKNKKEPTDVFQTQESRDNLLIARPHSQFIRAGHFNAGGHKHRNEPTVNLQSQGSLNFNVPSSIPPTRNINAYPQFPIHSNHNRPQIVLNSRPPISSLPSHLQLIPNTSTRHSRHNSNFNTPPVTSFALHHQNSIEQKPAPTKPSRPEHNLVSFESQKQSIRVPSFYHNAPLVSFTSTTHMPVVIEPLPPRHYFQRQHIPSSSHVYNVHEELPNNDIDHSGISQPLPHQMLLKTSHSKMAESHVSLLKNLQFGVNGEPLDVWIPMKSEKRLQASSRSHQPQAVSSSVPGARGAVALAKPGRETTGRAASSQSVSVPVFDHNEIKDVLDGDAAFDYNDYDEEIDRRDEPHAASSHEELSVAPPEDEPEEYADYRDDDQEEEESQFGQREPSHDDNEQHDDSNHSTHDDEESS